MPGKLHASELGQEIVRIVRLIPMVALGYVAISSSVYSYSDLEGASNPGPLLSLLDWAACYVVLTIAMQRAGLFSAGKRGRVGAYFAYGIVSGLALLLGFCLLVLPGLYLYIRWSPAVCHVLIRGDRPNKAMERAWEATSGAELAIAPHAIGGGLLTLMVIVLAAMPEDLFFAAPASWIIGLNVLSSVGILWLTLLPVATYRLLVEGRCDEQMVTSPA